MGWGAGRKLHQVLANTANVLAVEIMCAVAAIEHRAPLLPSPHTASVCARIRDRVERLEEDRPIGPDIKAIAALITSGGLSGILG